MSSPLRLVFFALALGACAPEADVDLEAETPDDVNPTAAQALTMPACGTALGTFDGTTAYSNGSSTGTGISCAGSGAYGLRYQCVELVMRHFKTHWGLRWYGNAKDLLRAAPTSTVAVYANGDALHPPVPGDMLVWTYGTWGHVVLVTGVAPDHIEVLEQNVSGSGRASLTFDGAHVGSRWNWPPPAGWAHARANGASPDAGVPCGVSGPPVLACATPATGWTCAQSQYAGSQFWTCSAGRLYRCVNGAPVAHACASGCVVRPLGTDDLCR